MSNANCIDRRIPEPSAANRGQCHAARRAAVSRGPGCPRPAHSFSRSSNFCTLPVDVLGSSATTSTAFGALYRAIFDLTCSISSSSVASRVRGEHHERLGPLAPLLVRHPDHGRLDHRRVRRDGLLDLDRGDVLAAGDHHVLGPVAQLDVAVGVHHAEVAAVEPAALERLLGGRRVVVVAEHHVVAAHHDLAHGGAVGGHVVHAPCRPPAASPRTPCPRPGGTAGPRAPRLRARPSRAGTGSPSTARRSR